MEWKWPQKLAKVQGKLAPTEPPVCPLVPSAPYRAPGAAGHLLLGDHHPGLPGAHAYAPWQEPLAPPIPGIHMVSEAKTRGSGTFQRALE